MADQKFLESLVPILIERVVRELTQEGIRACRLAHSDKFFPGIEIVAPILVE